MKKQHVEPTQTGRVYLEALISKGDLKAKAYRRALGLLELNRGKTYTVVSQTLQVKIPTLSSWVMEYKESGLQVLADEPRSGSPVQIYGNLKSKDYGIGLHN